MKADQTRKLPRNSAKNRPRIGITVGDAAGIGPEVVFKSLSDESLIDISQPVLIGDARHLSDLNRRLSTNIDFEIVKRGGDIPSETAAPVIYDLENIRTNFEVGTENEVTGRASAENIEAAVGLWKAGVIDAVATAPISKKAISLAGYDFPGHTEFLAHLTGTKQFAMSFFAGKLRVVLLSTHVSLRRAIELIKKDNLTELIAFTDRSLSKLLQRKVRIAVAGLNPHASEGGMFGSEEAAEIQPAVGECRSSGIEVFGPFSPDTIFLRAFRGEFDAVVACYHDQATIAVKCLSFGESVNVTLGLPLIRTSVDHGTAFDIAGQNKADASSMKAAIRLAADLAGD